MENKIFLLKLITFCLLISSCTSTEMYKEYSINNLNMPICDTLKYETKDMIIGAKILIVGEINGEAVLEIEKGSGRFYEIYLKGKINHVYEGEWYKDYICIKYKPISKIQGNSLKLKYRMKAVPRQIKQ